SFKIRGVGHLCMKLKQREQQCQRVICSSGGNAGLACAYACLKLHLKSIVVTPITTSNRIRTLISEYGSEVITQGGVWNEADEFARRLVEKDEGSSVYLPPFDHEDIWIGVSSIIDELVEQLPTDMKPYAIVQSVGGGGLLNGILYGLKNYSEWSDVNVIAMETEGADCFSQALKAKQLVTLPAITSMAKSLGALTVSSKSYELSHLFNLHSYVLPDAQAVQACKQFLDDHRMLVELASGVSLAFIYSNLFNEEKKQIKLPSNCTDESPIIIIVCGGSGITMESLTQLCEQFNLN
ncbi:unnamed protein product, partial [Didymodactylos carnosus]